MSVYAANKTPKKASPMSERLSKGDRTFYTINGVILGVIFLLVLLPILTLFANAFSDSNAVAAGRVTFWPLVKGDEGYRLGVSVEGFRAAFKNNKLVNGYMNTIIYTVSGTVLNLFLTILAAYPLSRSDLPGRNKIMMLFAFTMIFNAGMMPNYMLMQRLGLMNTRWVMILPMAINVYNMVICRTFFQSTIPRELLEAAQLDGCNDFQFVLRIVLPLSKAVIAVIGLYYAVYHWNAYFNAFMYLTDQKLYPLQIVLREILLSSVVSPEMLEGASTGSVDFNMIHVLRYAVIIIACLPIWCVYPFLQKYFVQGVMIGSIKG
ncbi:carbohydrate ABC transporter permease [Eubacteriales bacterium OttesenSCG-928-A19]|nr:carbohydrate ABC transporter permease [Eubacteriales bacterium OttesenSCG-928-A19]